MNSKIERILEKAVSFQRTGRPRKAEELFQQILALDPNQPDADFFRVTAWERTADYVSNYLSKGRLVAVEGRLETRKFVDNSGANREVTEIIADNVQGLDRPRDDSAGDSHGSSSSARPAATVAPSADEYDPFADE